jgi:hypothetical protein
MLTAASQRGQQRRCSYWPPLPDGMRFVHVSATDEGAGSERRQSIVARKAPRRVSRCLGDWESTDRLTTPELSPTASSGGHIDNFINVIHLTLNLTAAMADPQAQGLHIDLPEGA